MTGPAPVVRNADGRLVGEFHHRAKLSEYDVQQILGLHDLGLGYRRIAAKFDDIPGGISWQYVRDIIKGRRRGHSGMTEG